MQPLIFLVLSVFAVQAQQTIDTISDLEELKGVIRQEFLETQKTLKWHTGLLRKSLLQPSKTYEVTNSIMTGIIALIENLPAESRNDVVKCTHLEEHKMKYLAASPIFYSALEDQLALPVVQDTLTLWTEALDFIEGRLKALEECDSLESCRALRPNQILDVVMRVITGLGKLGKQAVAREEDEPKIMSPDWVMHSLLNHINECSLVNYDISKRPAKVPKA